MGRESRKQRLRKRRSKLGCDVRICEKRAVQEGLGWAAACQAGCKGAVVELDAAAPKLSERQVEGGGINAAAGAQQIVAILDLPHCLLLLLLPQVLLLLLLLLQMLLLLLQVLLLQLPYLLLLLLLQVLERGLRHRLRLHLLQCRPRGRQRCRQQLRRLLLK